MEEILASIRRIIEDSDTGRKSGDPVAPGATPEQAPPASEMETFRGELGAVARPPLEPRPLPSAPEPSRATARPGSTPVAEFAPKPFRLAEVQAQVAREAAVPARSAEAERKPLMLADIQQQLTKEAARAAPVAAAPRSVAEAAPRTIEAQPVVEATVAMPPPPVHADRPAQPANTDPRREEAAARAAAVAASMAAPTATAATASAPTARQSIISPVAGRQVSAAFGELSEAFAARSKKTLDELAEQMLRPMLQEWLDNNLPLLVEKLVREEIERVARGS
jgi:cell pole-organizing protein PopZ